LKVFVLLERRRGASSAAALPCAFAAQNEAGRRGLGELEEKCHECVWRGSEDAWCCAQELIVSS